MASDLFCFRLSQYTSAQLVQDNPNVADLSDLNRPTKLAEKFSELYDNDWTDAFEVLTDQFGFSEEQAIQRLYEIVMVCVCADIKYKHCKLASLSNDSDLMMEISNSFVSIVSIRLNVL